MRGGGGEACGQQRAMRIPYHNKADGFTAALILALNQARNVKATPPAPPSPARPVADP